jgi:hypothetical protein
MTRGVVNPAKRLGKVAKRRAAIRSSLLVLERRLHPLRARFAL